MSASGRHDRHARFLAISAGLLLVLVGLAGITRVLVGTNKATQLLELSQTTLVIGVVFLGQLALSKCRIAVDEAYKLGFDVGMEKGFREGHKVGKPVVVDLTYPADEVEIRHKPE